MTGLTRRIFPLVMALMMVFWLAACAGESQPDVEGGEEASEHAATEGGGEGAEHAEGGQAREGSEHPEGGAGGEHEGEHAEGGEHEGEHGEEGHDEEGEESGVYIGASETWDAVRRGARLVLSFDSQANSFLGTVENTTEQKICDVRIEVHLDTGTELGPTATVDLPAGETTSVRLSTEGEAFGNFTAHPEMSPCGDG